MPATFILYSTLGCHLCETAKALAEPVLAEAGAELVEQDIADSATLMERYGVRIPVLYHHRSGRELGWPFDESDLQQWLTTLDD